MGCLPFKLPSKWCNCCHTVLRQTNWLPALHNRSNQTLHCADDFLSRIEPGAPNSLTSRQLCLDMENTHTNWQSMPERFVLFWVSVRATIWSSVNMFVANICISKPLDQVIFWSVCAYIGATFWRLAKHWPDWFVISMTEHLPSVKLFISCLNFMYPEYLTVVI